MRHSRTGWLLIVTGIGVAACSKQPESTAPQTPAGETTQGSPKTATGPDIDAIRMTLLRERPDKADIIRSVILTKDGDVVKMRGVIPDEQLKQQLAERVRTMPGVGSVEDEMTTGASAATSATGAPRVEEIRMLMLQERPNDADIIRGLSISEDGGIVTLRGRVFDEQMRSDLTRAAKTAPGVRDVKEDLKVDPSAKSAKSGDGKSVEAIRMTLLRERPNASDIIRSLTITEDGDVVSVRGVVPDEAIRKQLMESARKGASGKTVRDEMTVDKDKNKKQ